MIFNKTVVSYSVAAALMAMTGSASASGFALLEQNASGLGNAFAGGGGDCQGCLHHLLQSGRDVAFIRQADRRDGQYDQTLG